MLGRRAVFEGCYELREAFQLLLQRPDKLQLVTGELWPSTREIADEADGVALDGETTMEGVEHLGQYVYEMTKTKLQQLQAERAEEAAGTAGGADEDGEDLADMPAPAGGDDGEDIVALPGEDDDDKPGGGELDEEDAEEEEEEEEGEEEGPDGAGRDGGQAAQGE